MVNNNNKGFAELSFFLFISFYFIFIFYILKFEACTVRLYQQALPVSCYLVVILFLGLRLLMKFMFTNLFGMFCGLCAEAGSLFFFHRCRSNLVFFLNQSSDCSN